MLNRNIYTKIIIVSFFECLERARNFKFYRYF